MNKEPRIKIEISSKAGQGGESIARKIREDLTGHGFPIEFTSPTGVFETWQGQPGAIPIVMRCIQLKRDDEPVQQLPSTKPVLSEILLVGNTYRLQCGLKVTITEANNQPGYECVKADDNVWRYNRDNDRGRCTGSPHDFSDPLNIVPLYAHNEPGLLESLQIDLRLANRRADGYLDKLNQARRVLDV